MKKRLFKYASYVYISAKLLVFLMLPTAVLAASQPLEVSGWIPYWQDTLGIKDARKHIGALDTVYPFAFSVKHDGTLADLADLESPEWRSFIRYARNHRTDIIPTVMWSDGTQIDAVLSDPMRRKAHIDAIVRMVRSGGYAGVDIDYEGKLSKTIDNFSLFLKELKGKLGSRYTLACTVEPRTPPDSLYRTVPDTISYANDYKAMGQICDQVEIMAYDQRRADLKLNDARKGYPYMPLADKDWVEKLIELALKDIPADKLVLGIPTYGQRYTVTVAPDWFRDYSRIGARNMPDLLSIAKANKVTPGRNAGGEMAFTYFATSTPWTPLNALPTPKGTPTGMEAAAKALLFANYTKSEVPFVFATYSDAGAVTDKVALAKKYKLKGVALFKIDGEEDQNIWRSL